MKNPLGFKYKLLAGSIATAFFALDVSTAFAALDEIIVTARKREESLQDVPVVVQAFTAETLEARGTTDFLDLNDQVSGLNINQSGTRHPSINMRGIQSDAVNAAADESISVNFNGVQHSSSQILRFGLFDLQSVEVLKGPQALFFGKNSPGGIVAFKTKDPTDEFFSEVQVGFEEAAERAYGHVIVSGPFNDNWGGRLSYRYQDADGYFDNVWGVPNANTPTPATTPADTTGPDFTENVVIGTIKGVFDRSDVTVKLYNGSRSGGLHTWLQYWNCELQQEARAAISDSTPFPSTNPYSDCRLDEDVASAPFAASDNHPAAAGTTSAVGAPGAYSDYELTQASLEFNYEINESWEFTNIIGYVTIENEWFGNPGLRSNALDGTPLDFSVGLDMEVEQVTEEFRFSGDFDNFRVMFGGFFDDRTTKELINAQLASGGAFILPGDPEGEVGGDSWSVFAQTDIDLTDQLELSIGGRYSEEDRDYQHTITGIPGAELDLEEPDLSFTNFSPELTLSWQPADNVTLFGSYKEGFKSGGYNPNGGAAVTAIFAGDTLNRSFDQEDVDGYELGFKLQLLDDTLRINGALFFYDYSNLQLPKVVALPGQVPTLETVNAGQAEINGLEVDALWQTPLPSLTVSANIAYNDNQYVDYIAQCSDRQLLVDATGCDVDVDNDVTTSASPLVAATNPGADATQRAGDPLRRAPEWSGSVSLNFDEALTDGLRFKASITATYSDEYQTTGFEEPTSVQDSYSIYGGNIGIYAEDESWSLDLIGRNLTDEAYINSGNPVTYFTDPIVVPRAIGGTRNAPREFMLQFTFRPDLFF